MFSYFLKMKRNTLFTKDTDGGEKEGGKLSKLKDRFRRKDKKEKVNIEFFVRFVNCGGFCFAN